MSQPSNYYILGVVIENKIQNFSKMEIQPCIDYDRIFLEPSPVAEQIRKKITKNGIMFSNLLDNGSIKMRAGLAQLYLIQSDWKNTRSSNSIQILFGKNIQRYKIEDSAREQYIEKNHAFNSTYKKQIVEFAKTHIEMQRIFSHIQNNDSPFTLLKASILQGDYIPIYTTTCIYPNPNKFDTLFILAVLNSRIVSYFAWKFIFCNAIRSMDLYEAYLRKLPIPKATDKQQKEIAEYARKLSQHLRKIPMNPDIKNYFIEPEIKKITMKDILQNKKGVEIKINDQITLGKLINYNLNVENNWIVFNVKYLKSNSGTVRDLEILRINEEKKTIHDYFLFNFNEKKKNPSNTEKNLYNVLIKEKLPFYGKTFNEHFDKTNQMLDKFNSEKKEYEKWLDVFKEIDLKIDILISHLFHLKSSEFEFILKYSRPSRHVGL